MKTEKQLNSLMASIRVLSTTRELPDVLRQLLQEALQVIDGSTAGVLFLYDEQQNVLYAESAIGFTMDALGKVRLKPGEGMSGKTFQQKKGSIYSQLGDTKAGMANLSQLNAHYYEQSLVELAYPVSAISVPLHLSDGTCIGVLTVDIFERNRTFEAHDLDLLETFARQASIAVENARLYSQNKRTQEIHQALSRVSLSYGGLGDITAALARLLSKDVVVFNEFGEELSRFPEQRAQTLPDELLAEMIESLFVTRNFSMQTWSTGRGEIELYSFPIQLDGEPIGLLILIGSKQALLNPLDKVAIEQALPLFVMELHQREKQDVNDLMYTGRLLEMMIHSKQPEGPSQDLLMHLPTGLHQHYVVAKVQVEHGRVPMPLYNRMKQQLMRKVYYELSKLHETAIVYERHFDLTFLFVVSPKQSFLGIETFLQELLGYAEQKWTLSSYAGIGRPVNLLSAAKDAHAEAVRAIHYLQRKQRTNQVITYDSLGPYRLFLDMNEADLTQYVSDKIGPIIDHDASGDLVKTLFVYLEQGQRLKEAALELYVHVNTVKYRLKKIYELLGITNLSVNQSFDIHLALKIAHYLEINPFSDDGQK
ncbi:sugar diacid utilization regulator/GAF domain-containing protein [Alkalihalobacillus xiaoxiensis]|uniref:Sugar diacid utilization regulator/GAF domain-containing protein n=1 Tax=Shouchella xiaoxiensis TaxID=766895 RepID=A0ABS2SU75_9BACI|nr:helix-turn-helix domain-containing protein [Shouchella xiaoxiensis]MBM7839089.1 sugar diacid utilization regulator/GAF domain-containing protein [Shouchella xiaoxiensis]